MSKPENILTMNLRLIFLIVFLFVGMGETFLMANLPTDRDSLLKMLDLELDDTTQIDVWNKLHFAYQNENPDSAFYYLDKAAQFSDEIGDDRRRSQAYLNLVNYYWNRGNYESARECLKKARASLDRKPDSKLAATYLMESAILNHFLGVYDSSIHYFLAAHSAYLELDDSIGAIKCLGNIGAGFNVMEQPENAFPYFEKVLNFSENKTGKDYLYMRMSALLNLSIYFTKKDEFKEALQYAKESLSLSDQLGFDIQSATNNQNIAAIYENQQLLDTALFHYQKASDIYKEMQNDRGILLSQMGIASIYAKKNNFSEAIDQFKLILKKAKENEEISMLASVHRNLSSTYEKMGNDALALTHYKEYKNWEDSLLNEAHLNRVKEIDLKFETSEKEKQIALLTQENEIQALKANRQTIWNQALVGGILLMLVIGGLIIYNSQQRLRNQKILASKNVELNATQFQKQVSELEMKALRAQMNPHFVFNCLNSINHIILNGTPRDASRYLTKFSKLLRMILENSEQSMVPLMDELEMLEAYIELETLRFKDKIQYKLNLQPDLDAEEISVPSMVLQPIVENAIWHGLMHKEGKGHLSISVKKESGYLKCQVEDDGVGRKAKHAQTIDYQPKNKSMGLQISKERLNLMGASEVKGSIEIEDLLDPNQKGIGTRVEMLIPIGY